MACLELQSSGPFSILKFSSVSLLLKWKVPFTELHTSQGRFFFPKGLDLPSASTLGNKAQNN